MIFPNIGTYPQKSIEQIPDGYLPVGVVVTFASVAEFCAWMLAHSWYEVAQWYGDVLVLQQTDPTPDPSPNEYIWRGEPEE